MRLMHLADLHIGKRVNGFQLLEDQEHILEQAIEVADDKSVDAVVIAGDVYDRPLPPVQAVQAVDRFLTKLVEMKIPVLMIGGNHDSVGRLAFLSEISAREGLHIAKPYSGQVEKVVLEDEHGDVVFHLLPFITPSDVRRFFPDAKISTYDEAMREVMAADVLEPGTRNVLVAHQLVLGGSEVIRSDSEQVSIGGLDQISADVFEGFDYVALGHLHAPQWVVPGKVRYAGSPLKYSFSEVNQKKSISIVSIDAQGETSVEEVPFEPLHGMIEVEGTLENMRELVGENPDMRNDYVRAILTEPQSNARAKLEDLFPLLMRIEFKYQGVSEPLAPDFNASVAKLSPTEVFADLFEKINGRPMNRDEEDCINDVAEVVEASRRESAGEAGDGE
ncbi:MAG: exonuclease SbcCD subunit D [Coriobacteriales bacterium]|jgi:exonuclease SbcD